MISDKAGHKDHQLLLILTMYESSFSISQTQQLKTIDASQEISPIDPKLSHIYSVSRQTLEPRMNFSKVRNRLKLIRQNASYTVRN